MADNNRNIASLVRNGGGTFVISDGIGNVDAEVLDAIHKLYDTVRTLDTKKGQWQIHERRDFVLPYFLEEELKKPSDGFVAVYERKGKPRTLFLGNLEDLASVNSTADEISKKVLEQRRWFAWPPRKLTSENGLNYGFNQGAKILVGGILILLVDSSLSLYGQITGNSEYGWLTPQFVKYSKSHQEAALGTMMGVLIALTGQTFLQAGVFSKLGKVADKRRIKNLPPKAFSFLYGPEAENAVLQEYSTLQHELTMTRLHQELRGIGVDIPKVHLAKIYRTAQTAYRDKIAAIKGYLIENPQGPKVQLEKIANVFSQAM